VSLPPAAEAHQIGADPAAAAEWRRLDPRMLVVNPLRQVIGLLPVLAGIVLAGSSTGRGNLWGLVGTGVAVGLGVLRWFTTTYRVAADRVQMRRGVLRRQVLSVPLDRVRTVDVSAPALHRVLGLVRVTVGTGQSDRKSDDSLRLDGLSTSDADRLRAELLHRPDPATAPASESAQTMPVEVLVAAPPSWARYGPFTLSGFLTVFAIAGVGWRIVSEARIDPTRLAAVTEGSTLLATVPLWLDVAIVGVLLLLVVASASTIGYVLAFHGFRLVRDGGSIQVTRGLVSTRSITLEERRLRGVELSEPLLLRLARGARCIAIATGLRVGRGAERWGSLLLPPAPRDVAVRVAAAILRTSDPVIAELARHGARAHRRRYTRLLLAWLPVPAILLALSRLVPVPAWAWQVAVAMLLLGVALAHDRYRSLGHALAGGILVTSRGSLVRRRCMLRCDGIIGWNIEQSFFQRRAGLATLVATTAAGRQGYSVQDVPLPEAVRLADEAVPGLLTPFLEVE
jgi:putative membrane protein